MQDGKKLPTVNSFCDDVIFAIVEEFGDSSQTRAITDELTPRHSSTAIKKNSGRLVLFDTRSAHTIDSDDCEEIDAEEDDGDDYVVSKRNKAKKPRSKNVLILH